MIRKTVFAIAVLTLFCALGAPSGAQASPGRELELRIFNLSRGYLRPMSATVTRLRSVAGFDGLLPIGHSEGVTRFKLSTAMKGTEIADALGLTLISADDKVLQLAPEGGDAAGIEARPKLLEIVQAIREHVKIDANGSAEPLFNADEAKEAGKCFAKLGLQTAHFEGEVFKLADYHIEQSQIAGIYTIWAGKSYQGVPVAASSIYGIRDDRSTLEPDEQVAFVGCKIAMGRWSSGFFWVDFAGCELNDYGFDRDAQIAKPRKELAVQAGARRVRTILLAAAKLRQAEGNRKKEAKDLPTGFLSDYTLQGALKLNEKDRDYTLYQHYPEECFHLSWQDDGGKVKARVRAHHRWHPMYLDGSLDADASLEGVNEKDLTTLTVAWAFAPEADADAFKARAEEADKAFGVISAALFAAGSESLEGYYGRLNGPSLKLLKVAEQTLRGASFGARDYSIERQMLNDVMIAVGSQATGGRRWQLLDMKDKKIIRTGQ